MQKKESQSREKLWSPLAWIIVAASVTSACKSRNFNNSTAVKSDLGPKSYEGYDEKPYAFLDYSSFFNSSGFVDPNKVRESSGWDTKCDSITDKQLLTLTKKRVNINKKVFNPKNKPDSDPSLLKLDQFDFVPSDIAPFCMPFTHPDKSFPADLKGIWWMNGNPVAETLVTFATTKWVPKSTGSLAPEGTITIDPQLPYTWAWYASQAKRYDKDTPIAKQITPETAGLQQFMGVTNQHLDFVLGPKGTEDKMEMVPHAFENVNGGRGIIPPGFLFSMVTLPTETGDAELKKVPLLGVKVEEDNNTSGPDILLRRTTILNGLIQGDYQLTRIVDETGKPTINYPIYLKTMTDFKLYYLAIKNKEKPKLKSAVYDNL